MWDDVTQFRNSSGPFISGKLCKIPSKADAMVTDTHAAKRKLNKTGTLILEEHLRLHPEDTHPTSYTLNALLDRVRNAQNNQNISYNSVSSWFQRRRSKLQKEALQQPTTSLTSPTMLFSPDNLRKLQTLVNATPNPSPDVLETWASLFHVPKAILHHAIHVILPEKASQDARQSQIHAEQGALSRLNVRPPTQRLPTPANSLTPEPVPAANEGGSPKFMKNECNTPTIAYSNSTGYEPDINAHSQQPRHHSTTDSVPVPGLHDQVAHSQLSPPPTPIVPTPQVNSQASETAKTSTTAALTPIPFTTHAIFTGIAEAYSDAVQSSHEAVLPPKTAAEFEAHFAPYKTRLETLSRMLDVTFEDSLAG